MANGLSKRGGDIFRAIYGDVFDEKQKNQKKDGRSPDAITESDVGSAKKLTGFDKAEARVKSESVAEQRELSDAKRREAQSQLLSDLVNVQQGMREISQARNDFFSLSSQAAINKNLIDQEIDEIIGAGQAQAGIERAKGETASELSSLKLAAQGQQLSGEGAKSVSRSHKILAATRAADAKTNALSKALGLDLEKVALDRRMDYGKIQRDMAYRSGITKMIYGIADAAINYQGTRPKGTSEDTKDTNRSPASGRHLIVDDGIGGKKPISTRKWRWK